MTDLVKRSRFYGAIDTGKWASHDLAIKAVMTPEKLTAAEQRRWVLMCTALEIPHDVGLEESS